MGAEGAKLAGSKKLCGGLISQAKGRSKGLDMGISVDVYIGVDLTGVYAQYSGFLFTYYYY